MSSTIEAEFAKVGFDPAVAAEMAAKAKAAAKDEDEDGDGGDGAPGREDLVKSLDKGIMDKLNNADNKSGWKERKAGMEAIMSACSGSGNFIKMDKGVR